MSSKNCPVCSEPILEAVESWFLQEKGAEEVNRCSKQRDSNLFVQTSTEMHVNCRRRYTYKKDIVAYIKGQSELLLLSFLDVPAEIMVQCFQKTRCVIWNSEKIQGASIQTELNISCQNYVYSFSLELLTIVCQRFWTKLRFSNQFAKFLFKMQEFLKSHLNDQT